MIFVYPTKYYFLFSLHIIILLLCYFSNNNKLKHLYAFKLFHRYLGSGCDQIDLHLTYRIGHTTIGKILRKVCSAIWEVLREECFPELTTAQWKKISEDFQKYSQYPNCLGR